VSQPGYGPDPHTADKELDFEIIGKKRLFFQFRGVKNKFQHFGTPWKKFWENPLLVKILPTPMAVWRQVVHPWSVVVGKLTVFVGSGVVPIKLKGAVTPDFLTALILVIVFRCPHSWNCSSLQKYLGPLIFWLALRP